MFGTANLPRKPSGLHLSTGVSLALWSCQEKQLVMPLLGRRGRGGWNQETLFFYNQPRSLEWLPIRSPIDPILVAFWKQLKWCFSGRYLVLIPDSVWAVNFSIPVFHYYILFHCMLWATVYSCFWWDTNVIKKEIKKNT